MKFVRGTNTGKDLLFTGTPAVGQRKHVNVNPTKLFSTKPMPPKGTLLQVRRQARGRADQASLTRTALLPNAPADTI